MQDIHIQCYIVCFAQHQHYNGADQYLTWVDPSTQHQHYNGRYQSVWTKRRSRLDCGNDSPMLQMMRKDEAPYMYIIFLVYW